MGISCSTPASSSISPTGSFEMSPYTPTSVISSPTILPVLKPRPWSLSSTAATSSRVASRRILTSMAGLSLQDGRTAARCNALMAEGLLVSPLAAATKIEWILDRVDADRAGVRSGRLRCGTVDAWLAWRLTAGRVFASDASNASCSGFYDLLTRGWSAAILEALRVPAPALPAIVDSSAVLGRLGAPGLPPIPLAALIGDQQAAVMGQLRLAAGEVKITYGTSAMLDLNAGAEPLWSTRGAYPLVLWQRGGVPTFCLEGTAIT